MKKNITINLFGTLYAIDEDACQLLEQYTENMRSYFSKQEGGDEIVDDIEHRIAELLWENKEQGHEAVDIQTIKNIINKIGDVEQMGNGEQKTESHEQTLGGNEQKSGSQEQTLGGATGTPNNGIYGKTGSSEQGSRKLYRNGNDKMLGGVLSGLAQYFGGKDPLPWRIGFIILAIVCFISFKPNHPFGNMMSMMSGLPGDPFNNGAMPGMMFGMMEDMTSSMFSPYNFFIRLLRWSPLIAYLALWAFVPMAKTVEDRLKMQGKKVDPSNIKKEVISEHEKQNQPVQQKGCANGCLSIFVFIGKVLGIGCLGCLGTIVVLIILSLLFGWGVFHVASWSDFPSKIENVMNQQRCDAPDLTVTFDLNDEHFTAIDFNGVGELKFTQGDEYKIVADGDSCLVADFKYHIENGCLNMDDNKAFENKLNLNHGNVTFWIIAPSIEKICQHGIGDINMPDSVKLNTDLTIEIEGVGNAEVAYVASPHISLNRRGVGDVHMRVDTEEFNVWNTGVGSCYLGGYTDVYNEKECTEFVANIYRDELTVGK